MTRRVVVLLTSCLLISAVCWGEPKILALKDGQTISGDVTETKDGYQVTLKSGITVTYAKSQVVSVRGMDSPKLDFDKKLQAAAEANTAEAYYQAGDWAFRNNMIEEAKKALEAGLKISPQHAKSKYLLKQINAIPSTGVKAGAETKPSIGVPAVKDDGGTVTKVELEKYYLGDADINRIKQVELREKDSVIVDFRKDSLNRYASSLSGQNKQAFMVRSNGAKAYAILHNNPSFAPDIFIRTDPQFMVDFQKKVWPKVRQTCATVACHGGEKTQGGLKFFNPPASSSKVDYTNFLILVNFVKANERLVDRSNPDSSLILNYMLPPDMSKAQSGHVKKFPPLFTGRDSKEYKELLDWISALSYPPTPDYHVEWKPPLGIRLEGAAAAEEQSAPSAPAQAATPATAPAAGNP